MITIISNIKVKKDAVKKYKALAAVLSNEFIKLDGCIAYTFNQKLHEPTEFVLYEQWLSKEDISNHVEILTKVLGPPKAGEVFPAKLTDLYEEAVPNFYTTIE